MGGLGPSAPAASSGPERDMRSAEVVLWLEPGVCASLSADEAEAVDIARATGAGAVAERCSSA
jgi:hypothetical protein